MVPLSCALGFAAAVTPLVITPGASFTLVSARGVVGDRRGAWQVIAGTAAGILTHGCLAGLGLAMVVMRSAEAYRVVQLVGALYLVGLGATLVWRARTSAPAAVAGAEEDRPASQGGPLWRAYVANVLNVKAASVYLTLAPQFVGSGQVGVLPLLALAGVHVAIMAAWLGLWSLGLLSLAERLDPRRWVRAINAAGGAVLVALGCRTAAEAV